jgi:hypothetical protein
VLDEKIKQREFPYGEICRMDCLLGMGAEGGTRDAMETQREAPRKDINLPYFIGILQRPDLRLKDLKKRFVPKGELSARHARISFF